MNNYSVVVSENNVQFTITPQPAIEVEINEGRPGKGVPAGGLIGQALIKVSDTDYDTDWGSVASSGGSDGSGGRNIDGGTASSVYGGTTGLDGGGA